MNAPDFDKAANFIVANARVVDRRRFQRMFGDGSAALVRDGPAAPVDDGSAALVRDGPAAPVDDGSAALVRDGPAAAVRDAVAAYRNDDGGFGHGLEPDWRAPGSQPAAVEMALRIMDQADAWDEALVQGACDWLTAVAPAEGGAAFVEPTSSGWPHAPWWVPEEGHPASLIATGLIGGTLYARGFSHPWLDRATEVMWTRIGKLTEPGGYEMFGVLAFLQHVPDRDRAREAFGRVGPLIVERNLATLDPEAPGETHGPLDFAPEPDSLARSLFDDATIKAHLDHLAHAQRDDGGWTFNWLAWSLAAEREWRGFLTVDALRILRANGLL